MPFDYVLLKTDALLYLLLIFTGFYVVYARQKEHLCIPWRQVARNKLGMMSAVILSFFLSIAILDSIHFHPALERTSDDVEIQYSTEIISLFDVIVKPLRTRVEKTYSAPFATHAYSKETIEQTNGETRREYPRLVYGGSHLENPETERTVDIIKSGIVGLIKGLIASALIISLLIFWQSKQTKVGFKERLRVVLQAKTEVPWWVIFVTFCIMMILVFVSAELSLKYHIFGTDKVGMDVFYQSLKSIRTGLLIGTLTTLVMLPFALILGVMAGYFRGWVDDVIQYLYTTLSSIPGVLLIAAAALMLEIYMAKHAAEFTSLAARADLRLLFLCMILGITSWTGLCRLLRGEALKLREIDYIEASKAFGVSHMTIIFRHMLPNVMHIVMISVVIDFSGLVLAEAVLTYINIGVDPSMESWGNMINSARLELAREPVVWWSLAAAFIFMLGLVLSANLFSDAVRDAFDPRLSGSK
ncbi:MAG: ABC transporter permease [Proteobacteria bacterium]|nr:ABC transporter permease [Pseudomonadota bacterium]